MTNQMNTTELMLSTLIATLTLAVIGFGYSIFAVQILTMIAFAGFIGSSLFAIVRK